MFVPTNLVDYLVYSATHYPNKEAVVCGDVRLTYGKLHVMTNQVANALCALGIKRGDRILLCLDNQIETVVLFWAALKANAVISIINPGIALQKLIYIIKDSGATFLCIKDEALLNEINKLKCALNKIILVNKHSETDVIYYENLLKFYDGRMPKRKTIDIDLAAIIYTSGSTGLPKGVMLSQRNMLAASASICEYLKLQHDDIIISALPMSFDYGLYQMILAFQASATLIVEKDFVWPIQFIKKISEEKVTILPGVPTLFSILANHLPKITYDLSSVRCVTNTGAALFAKHVSIIQSLFPHAIIFSMYGLTECKRCTYLPPEDIAHKSDSVGIAIPNTEIWVVDETHKKLGPNQVGQLVIRGATVMQGYWNKPVESDRVLKEGFLPGEKVLYTGDYGYLDQNGYFYFCGRMDETIKRYGEKVSLKEIEETIYLLPAVNEVAVIDVPDEIIGSAIIAFVGSDKNDNYIKHSIVQHCKSALAKTHWPQDVFLLPELPKNTNGKFDKSALKNHYIKQLST